MTSSSSSRKEEYFLVSNTKMIAVIHVSFVIPLGQVAIRANSDWETKLQDGAENGHDPSACCNITIASMLFGFCASDLGGR